MFPYLFAGNLFTSFKSCIEREPYTLSNSCANNLLANGCQLCKQTSRRAYFSKDNTAWGCWLAWANMAVAACWMICVLDNWVDAVA